MKKRVKLLTTIASLCLAVALMAFGVYAAGNPANFATNSTVSFTATTDVFGTFTASVSKTGTEGALDTLTTTRANTAGSAWSDTALASTAGKTLGTSLVLSAVEDEYVFTFTFENASPYAVTATPTTTVSADVMQANAPTEVAIDTTDITTTDAQTIAVGGDYTWTIKVKLLSLDIAANQTINVNFALAVQQA